MKSISPFQFSGLPKYTRNDVALSAALSSLVKPHVWESSFLNTLKGLLSSLLHTEVQLECTHKGYTPFSQAYDVLPQQGCMAVVSYGQGRSKILCAIDGPMAMVLIDHLLGGQGDAPALIRPFTDIEKGLLSFVFLNVLDAVKIHAPAPPLQKPLGLEGVVADAESIRGHLEQSQGFFSGTYSLVCGGRSGVVQLHVPADWATQHFGSSSKSALGTQFLDFFANHTYDIRFELSTLDLTYEDLCGLQPGDIVVMDNTDVRLGAFGAEGTAHLKVGLGKSGLVRGKISSEGEDSLFTVENIGRYSKPAEVHMSFPLDHTHETESSQRPSQAGLGPTEGLMEDMEHVVVVEFARMKMNTAQIAKLHEGQVLRLPRGPLDPVDIVVNGRVYARGELVDVEGELGLRLTQVAGR
jgi:flagellar motor switch/type III secretory pathway protein FliN